jgi:hypothetical protein
VDRRALAAQATQAFASFITPSGNKFNQEYELFSQRFRKEEFQEDDKFDVGVMRHWFSSMYPIELNQCPVSQNPDFCRQRHFPYLPRG